MCAIPGWANYCEKENTMSDVIETNVNEQAAPTIGINDLEQFLVNLFQTVGIDFGDDDYCSIIEAVEEVMPIAQLHHLSDHFLPPEKSLSTENPLQVYLDAMEELIGKVMPRVVVALVQWRNPELAKRYEDEKILEAAKILLTMSHPSPRRTIEAIEATLN
jgi:hypothetical protein